MHVIAARVGDTPTVMLATYSHVFATPDSAAAERIAALVAPSR